MSDKRYSLFKYCGDGLGIAGMPHELTREQAEQLGILEKLDEAIAAGVYKTERSIEKEEADNG
jgi:hypothetical protein